MKRNTAVSFCPSFKGTWNTYAILEDSCDDDEFKCPSTSLCLPPTSICDGIVDCDSEDDEKDCKECTRGALVIKPLVPAHHSL